MLASARGLGSIKDAAGLRRHHRGHEGDHRAQPRPVALDLVRSAGISGPAACGLSMLGSGGPRRLPGWRPGCAARRVLGSHPRPDAALRAAAWPSRWSSSAACAHAVVVSVLTPAETLIAARRLAGARPHLAAVASIVHHEDLWQLCRAELTGLDIRSGGWDIRGRWFGVVIGAAVMTPVTTGQRGSLCRA